MTKQQYAKIERIDYVRKPTKDDSFSICPYRTKYDERHIGIEGIEKKLKPNRLLERKQPRIFATCVQRNLAEMTQEEIDSSNEDW